MSWALFSRETQHFSCSPPGYKPKASPQIPHFLDLSWLHKQFAIHSGSESPSSHSSSFLQDLGYVVISLRVIVQKSMCRVTLDHGETQERHRS